MKTKLIVIAGIMLVVGLALVPTASAANNNADECAFQNAAPAQIQQCDGQQKGNRTGPQDGTKGENAPRDGRGKGNGKGNGNGNGQCKRAGCQKS